MSVENAIQAGFTRDVTMVKIEHPDGDVYMWSGVGKLEYGGHTWEGYGALGSVQLSPADSEVKVADVAFTMSGVDPEWTGLLTASVKGKRAWVWKVFLDENHRVALIEEVADVLLDQPVLQAEPNGTITVRINATGGFYMIDRQSRAIWDPEYQRSFLASRGEDPDSDTGFDLMHSMKNKQVAWLPG